MNPEIPEPTLDPTVVLGIQKGVDEFNAGKFFECHDTLEEIWQETRGPARDFFQGLIQISVGFYHLRNGNLRGGQSQLEKGLNALQRYGNRYAGMELENLRGEVGVWLERVRAGENLRAQVADLPKYHFTPPA